MSTTSPSKLWTSSFTLLLFINFLGFVTCQALNNGTPIYVSFQGGTTAFSGALILEFSLFAAVSRIFAGRLIDNGSRQRIMLIGAAMLLLGTIPTLAVPGVAPQLVLRALQGAGFGCVHTAASTAAADVLPQERLGQGIGYFSLGQSLGMAIGPTFAVVLTSMVYAESLFLGAAGVAGVLFLCALCCRYEANFRKLPQTSAYRQRRETAGESFNQKPTHKQPFSLRQLFVASALPAAIPMFIVCLGYSIIVNFTSLYATKLGIFNPGSFFIFAAITMTLVRLCGGSLLERVNLKKLMCVPILCGMASLVLLANLADQYVLWVAGALFGLSMGLVFPILNTVCVKNIVPERWGSATAMFGLTNDLGIGIGALIWGAVSDFTGFPPIMYGGCLMLALAYLAALALIPKGISASAPARR